MNDEKDLMRVDDRTQERVIESLVLRGDLSGLAPKDRARFYVQVCEGLGLNPASNPLAFLRLNGKEILYPTRGATDQLAAIHRVNREIIDGPKVIDLAGTKLVYAVCRASLPNGRVETATATVPLVDPMNVLMKAETKAKRRATLSILGLGLLDEMELETIPANVQEPGGGVDFSQLSAQPADPVAQEPSPVGAEVASDPSPAEVPAQLGAFYGSVQGIELPGEAVAVWMKHRADLAPLSGVDREAAWKALCRRTEEVGRMKNAKVWLKKAIAEEDARRGMGVDPGAALPGAGDPRAAPPRSALDDVRESAEARHTVRELADLWRLARADLTAAGCDAAGWKLIADRALVLGLIPGAVSAEVTRRDTPSPPDGPGGAPKPAANDSADAQGSAAESAPAQGALAMVPPWCCDEASARAHIAGYQHTLAVERSARRYRQGLPVYARELLALRYQRLSWDPRDGEITIESARELVARWIAQGPIERVRPEARRRVLRSIAAGER